MKMLSANTVNAAVISVTTVNKHKDGNPPKKAAPRKPRAKKAVEKQGSKAAAKGGNKKHDAKGTSIIDADFFNFPPPSVDPGEDPASGTASLKMGITELSSPLPSTKDYHKQRMQRAKGVKVPTRPAALKVQVGWKMIEVFDKSTDVDFKFQKAMVNKLLSSHAGNFVDCVMKSLQMKLELLSLEVTEANVFLLLLPNALDNIMEYTNESLHCNGLIPMSHVEFCCFLGTLLLSSAFNASQRKHGK